MSDKLSRRRFLAGLGRWSLLAGLGGLVARSGFQALAGKGGSGTPAYLAVCRGCGLLPACQLPQGVDARAALNVELASTLMARAGKRGACGAVAAVKLPSSGEASTRT
jgi:hypothetical protein